MVIALIIGCSVLFFIALILLVRLIVIKKQIREFTDEVRYIVDNDTKEPIKVSSRDKDIIDLARAIDLHVDRSRNEYASYVKDRERINYLVSGISHDFRTPLTSSLGYIQLIEKSGELKDPKNVEYFNIIKEKNNYLKMLSDDFFDVSKLALNKDRKKNIEEIDLSRLVEEELLQYYDRINSRGIKTDIFVEKGVRIMSEALDVTRITDNLLSNAAKYSATFINVRLEGKKLTVSNDITPENVFDEERIFELFYQGGVRGQKGSGVGLYVVKCLADDLGFEVTSKKENDVFEITLVFEEKQL
ncbi:MAG: HAMP domain-containing histidine kinase [Clostridiales bacterium]|nr:HAMP domain-containing histidine kinase [Clostridiales bacterium]